MTNKELRAALYDRRPVLYNRRGDDESEYAFVSAIINRKLPDQRLILQAEITDKNGHSVSIVNPRKLRFAESGSPQA